MGRVNIDSVEVLTAPAGRVFIFVKNEKNEKFTVFHWLFFRLLTEFMTDVVRLSGGFFYVCLLYTFRCV